MSNNLQPEMNQNNTTTEKKNLYIENFYETSCISLESPFVVQGNIYDENNNSIVCHGVPVSKDLKNLENLEKVFQNGSYQARPFYEGSLLRIFYFENKWNVATSRKLSAFESKWGSMTSFGELFEEYLKKDYNTTFELFCESLSIEYNYYFLFTSEAVFYIHPSSSSTLRLMYVKDKNGKLVDDDILGVPKFEYFSIQEIKEKFEKNEILGIVLENQNERYCLFSDNYQSKKKIYGNNKFLAARILELSDEEKQKFLEYFPQSAKYFELIHQAKLAFCKNAHRVYVQRYIQKIFVEVDPSLNHFVKSLHANFKENKKPTYYEDVILFFLNKTPESKFSYLRKYLPKNIGGHISN